MTGVGVPGTVMCEDRHLVGYTRPRFGSAQCSEILLEVSFYTLDEGKGEFIWFLALIFLSALKWSCALVVGVLCGRTSQSNGRNAHMPCFRARCAA